MTTPGIGVGVWGLGGIVSNGDARWPGRRESSGAEARGRGVAHEELGGTVVVVGLQLRRGGESLLDVAEGEM